MAAVRGAGSLRGPAVRRGHRDRRGARAGKDSSIGLPASFPAAFWVVMDGFSPSELGIDASDNLTNPPLARKLAHPASRGFVDGLRGLGLPQPRHPSYAATSPYRVGTLTL